LKMISGRAEKVFYQPIEIGIKRNCILRLSLCGLTVI